ncbi:MAG: sulfotransferase domain-containing protein, partial [Acidiferrobacterales bacterium]|nr:sulfotransferase domain-containing protein [Acidiferrobacterales bacterium]
MTFIWLCSYPKSGNTWLRALLTSYLNDHRESQDSDRQLIGPSSHLTCHLFDETMGLNSSELTPQELDQYRYVFHKHFVQRFRGTTFTKVHESYLSRYSGHPMFPQDANCKAIYLIRNPLDIVPSYAHHDNSTLNEVIKHTKDSMAVVRHG